MAIGGDGRNHTRRIGNNTGFVQGDIAIVIGIHLISILLQGKRTALIIGCHGRAIDRLTRFIAEDQGECRCETKGKDCLCLGNVKFDCSLFLKKQKISHQSPFQCCFEEGERRSRNERFLSSSSRFQDHQALTHIYNSYILSANALVSTGCRGDYLAFAIVRSFVRSLLWETMCCERNCGAVREISMSKTTTNEDRERERARVTSIRVPVCWLP